MTIDQFDLTGFTGQYKVEYDGRIYDIHSIDFKDKLFAIDYYNDDEDLKWVRCENIKLILN